MVTVTTRDPDLISRQGPPTLAHPQLHVLTTSRLVAVTATSQQLAAHSQATGT
jgi:hypothetical protein